MLLGDFGKIADLRVLRLPHHRLRSMKRRLSGG